MRIWTSTSAASVELLQPSCPGGTALKAPVSAGADALGLMEHPFRIGDLGSCGAGEPHTRGFGVFGESVVAERDAHGPSPLSRAAGDLGADVLPVLEAEHHRTARPSFTRPSATHRTIWRNASTVQVHRTGSISLTHPRRVVPAAAIASHTHSRSSGVSASVPNDAMHVSSRSNDLWCSIAARPE